MHTNKSERGSLESKFLLEFSDKNCYHTNNGDLCLNWKLPSKHVNNSVKSNHYFGFLTGKFKKKDKQAKKVSFLFCLQTRPVLCKFSG